MPPKFPATKDRTKTPNKSSPRFTRAVAPLSAKTKVPARSSAEFITCQPKEKRIALYASGWSSKDGISRY